MRYLNNLDTDVYVEVNGERYYINLNPDVIENLSPKEIIKELYLKASAEVVWEEKEIDVYINGIHIFTIKKSTNGYKKINIK